MADLVILSDRVEEMGWLQGGAESAGYRVSTAPLAGGLGHGPDPDVVVVDAAKDITGGRDACRGLRSSSPKLTIVALVRADAVDALGPDWGIDTFLVEGAGIAEALARVRVARGAAADESSATIRVGDLAIDPETYQVRLRSRPLDLTYKEFQLLAFLAQRPGRVFSRSQLLQEVWGYDFFGGTRTVDVHVRRLRAKLGAEHEAMIATVRNVGYKIERPRSRA